jgi:DNA invertase Pin-like site-specific DNA recombinase
MTAALIYTRVSTIEQVENLSLDTQERECRAHCRREGLKVDRVFR